MHKTQTEKPSLFRKAAGLSLQIVATFFGTHGSWWHSCTTMDSHGQKTHGFPRIEHVTPCSAARHFQSSTSSSLWTLSFLSCVAAWWAMALPVTITVTDRCRIRSLFRSRGGYIPFALVWDANLEFQRCVIQRVYTGWLEHAQAL